MDEIEIIDAEPVLEPLPILPPTETQCMARRRQSRGYCSRPGHGGKTFARCKHHGGMTPSGPAHGAYKHGRKSKSQYLPQSISNRMEDLNGNVIENLEESVLIQQALETKIHEQLKSGESSANWSDLRHIFTETRIKIKDLEMKSKYGDDDNEEVPEGYIEAQTAILKGDAYDQMEEVVFEGASRYAVQIELRKHIQSIHDSQRKLTETITKSRREIMQTYSQEEWSSMINELMLIIKAHVTRDVLQLIARDIEARQVKQLEN